MPYDSLVALGSRHPQSVLGGVNPVPITKPAVCYTPQAARESARPTDFTDIYLKPAAPLPPLRGHIFNVKLNPGRVHMHPAWQATAIAPAIDASGLLDLHKLSGAMLLGLEPTERRSLMMLLSTVKERVAWCDVRGQIFSRKPLLWLPIGRHFRINAATGLVMLMAQDCNRSAYRQCLVDGLPYVVDELQGSASDGLFPADDVAFVITSAIDSIRNAVDPADAWTQMGAAGTLVQHYIKSYWQDRHTSLDSAIQLLMQAVGRQIERSPANVGLALGIVLSGAFKNVGYVAGVDFHRRWRIASLSNMVWAASSFIPMPVVAGAVATAVVGTAIWWDYLHPPRDFSDMVRRFESQFLFLSLQGRLGFNSVEVGEMLDWMRCALGANNFG